LSDCANAEGYRRQHQRHARYTDDLKVRGGVQSSRRFDKYTGVPVECVLKLMIVWSFEY